MTKRVVDTIKADDGEPMIFDHEIMEVFGKAIEAAMDLSGEAAHFMFLPDGNAVAGVEIIEETMSDSSKAYSLRILTSNSPF